MTLNIVVHTLPIHYWNILVQAYMLSIYHFNILFWKQRSIWLYHFNVLIYHFNISSNTILKAAQYINALKILNDTAQYSNILNDTVQYSNVLNSQSSLFQQIESLPSAETVYSTPPSVNLWNCCSSCKTWKAAFVALWLGIASPWIKLLGSVLPK